MIADGVQNRHLKTYIDTVVKSSQNEIMDTIKSQFAAITKRMDEDKAAAKDDESDKNSVKK